MKPDEEDEGDELLQGYHDCDSCGSALVSCFSNPCSPRSEFAPDLLADPDLVLIDKLFVPCCIATLALPFGIGYALTGTLAGALGALVWAGIVRISLGHNLTWSINSICHQFGKRPFRTRDQSTCGTE